MTSSGWVDEWLEADEIAFESGWVGWVSRDIYPDMAAAKAFARRQTLEPDRAIMAVPVLLRITSEVETRIRGAEWPFYVECTTRARRPLAYWRIMEADAEMPGFVDRDAPWVTP
jgi:hypothetical protein